MSSMMKRTLVIINSEQFGYNPATYYYCKYLRNRYKVTYIGWDHGLKKINMPGVRIEYARRSGGLAIRVVRFLKKILVLTSSTNSIIFIKHFKGISTIIRLARRHNPLVLDIRTGSIESNRLKRFIADCIIKFESKLFKNVTVISQSLASRLGLIRRATLLPLGADIISETNKSFTDLNLLYVGTLYNRNIDQAVKGFAGFYQNHRKDISTQFTIIGAGLGSEVEFLKSLVKKLHIDDVVHIIGRVPHDQLQKYFDSHNVGVSYIPITDYYDVQPATKTFEYLLSGMPVIATANYENKLAINESNGIVTGDTAEEFSQGIVDLYNKRSLYNSSRIRNDAYGYKWENIVADLSIYLESISEKI